jgi:hypothetical protein
MRSAVTIAVVAAGLLTAFSVVSGCHNGGPAVVATENQGMQSDLPDAFEENDRTAGGAQVWAQNCMRCHNLRRPHERSDREWDLIVHHMRVRAGLTAKEHRLIREFLQSAN